MSRRVVTRMWVGLRVVVFGLALVHGGSVSAQEVSIADLEPELLGAFGGEVSAVEVGGDAVYVAVGARVRVLGRGQQASELGQSPILEGRIHDMVYQDGVLLAAAGTAGLLMLDVTSPEDVALIGQVEPPVVGQRYTELELLGDDRVLVSVANREGGGSVQVLERGADWNLRMMADTALDGVAANMDLLGDRLVVGMPGIGLVLLELDRVSGQMMELGRVEDSLGQLEESLGIAAVLGERVFLADEIWLHEIDWSEPSSPRFLGRIGYDLWPVGSLQSESGRLCMSGLNRGASMAVRCFAIGDGTLVGDVGFDLADDRRRFNPPSLQGPAVMALDGDVIYLAAGAEGLHRLEPGQPGAGPSLISEFETKPLDLVLQGDLAFTTSQWTGLEIWDTSVSGEARRLWAQVGLRSNELAVDGQWLYSQVSGGIEVRDISDPAAPDLLGLARLTWRHDDTVASDGLLHLLGRAHGTEVRHLRIVDARNPGHVQELASLPLPATVGGWDVRGGRLWYSTGAQELVEVDLSDPSRPRERARHVIPWAAGRIQLTEDRLVASTDSWVQVYDIGQPDRLLPIGDRIAGEFLEHVAADGHLLGMTGRGSGVRVLDMTGPIRIVEVARWVPETSRAQQGARLVDLDEGRLVAGFGTGTTQTVRALDLAEPRQFASEAMLAADWNVPTDLVSMAGREYLATGWSGDWILDLRASGGLAVSAQLPGREAPATSSGTPVPARRVHLVAEDLLVTSPFEIFELDGGFPAGGRRGYTPVPDAGDSVSVVHPQTLIDENLGFLFWQPESRNELGVMVDGPVHMDVVRVDRSKPPEGLGRLIVGDLPRDLARHEGYLYVAGRNLFWIIDARDPKAPLVDHWQQRRYQALVARDARLWALDRDRLDVFDLSRPDDPRRIASLTLPASAPEGYEGRFSISRHGLLTYGAIAFGEHGLLLLDLSDAQPEIVGRWQPSWPVAEVSLSGRRATVAFEQGGLMTLAMDLEPGPMTSWIHLPLVSR